MIGWSKMYTVKAGYAELKNLPIIIRYIKIPVY